LNERNKLKCHSRQAEVDDKCVERNMRTFGKAFYFLQGYTAKQANEYEQEIFHALQR
jgi:hypothetical protein